MNCNGQTGASERANRPALILDCYLRPPGADRSAAEEPDFGQPYPHDVLEARISAALWAWRFSGMAGRDQLIADSQFALMLEYWMPVAEIDQAREPGMWCDGIPLLRIGDLSRTVFIVRGVGYFPQELSPFEIKLNYQHRRDLAAARITLCLGMLDDAGQLRTIPRNKDPNMIFSVWPSDVREWAVAAELTRCK